MTMSVARPASDEMIVVDVATKKEKTRSSRRATG
jgi:hypothetical protein